MNQESQVSQKREPSRISFYLRLILAVAVMGLIVGYSMTYQVPEGNAVVVTRFERPVRETMEAGLYWKAPWPIDRANHVDTRKRIFNTPFTATLTRDRKNVILLSYVVWKVDKPERFYTSVDSPRIEKAEHKLDGMVTAAKNFHLGNHNLSGLVSVKSEDIKIHEIERAILNDVEQMAMENFGIRILQVGFKRIAYPEENVNAVLDQMRAERRTEAVTLRAKGEKEAQRIRDDALVNSEETLKKGREQAGIITGEAEKEAARIYADAHRLDPKFYSYWRSLQAAERTLGDKATLILRTDQGPFEILTDPPTIEKDSGARSSRRGRR
ncbi:MAG: protease modulator HflC [Verrucomicrobiota bacterium]